jgi:hypothetical protein
VSSFAFGCGRLFTLTAENFCNSSALAFSESYLATVNHLINLKDVQNGGAQVRTSTTKVATSRVQVWNVAMRFQTFATTVGTSGVKVRTFTAKVPTFVATVATSGAQVRNVTTTFPNCTTTVGTSGATFSGSKVLFRFPTNFNHYINNPFSNYSFNKKNQTL